MKHLITILLIIEIVQFGSAQQKALFEPIEDKVLLVIGQDQGSVGGFPKPNNDGYVDHIDVMPGGVTSYISLPGLGGMIEKVDYGCGVNSAQSYMDNKKFDHSTLVLGLYMVNELQNIVNGRHDEDIINMGEWIKEQKRPVFLRIGYEFDGEWNHYDPELYIKSYQRIVNMFRNIYVENCATVWQSSGRFDTTTLMKWYPGDDYVDWVGYSHFDNWGEGSIAIARNHKKPVMIAESTPLHLQCDEGDPVEVWNNWFGPFFKHVRDNKDIIKAVAYINADWDNQPMWAGQNWGDSRVQANEKLKKMWLEEITSELWLNASADLFDQLNKEVW